MEHEETHNANEHYKYLAFVLSAYGKNMLNIFAV